MVGRTQSGNETVTTWGSIVAPISTNILTNPKANPIRRLDVRRINAGFSCLLWPGFNPARYGPRWTIGAWDGEVWHDEDGNVFTPTYFCGLPPDPE
jgi:hypothetical protein